MQKVGYVFIRNPRHMKYSRFYKFLSLQNIYNEDGTVKISTNCKLKQICDNNIWVPAIKDLNDPFECVIQSAFPYNNTANEIFSSASHRGAYCMSATPHDNQDFILKESVLMWAYYADANKGICIEYNKEIMDAMKLQGLNRDFMDIQEIEYISEPCTFQSSSAFENINEYRDDVIRKKNKLWEHENEVRLVFKDYGVKRIPPQSATAIYCGCYIGDKHLSDVIKLAKSLNVPCHRLMASKNSFEYEIIDK